MKYLHVVPRNYEVMREIVRFFRKYFGRPARRDGFFDARKGSSKFLYK